MNTHYIYSWSDFLGQVWDQKCWTAWRTEQRKNKTTGEVKTTKVPYQTVTSESRSNDPTTWISIDDAEAVAATEGFINGGMGGVGLWLGIEYGTEYRVGGVDLDSCLTPTGPALWAKEIIDRFDTYGEISPSRTGIKLYFLYRVADLDAIRLITGTPWSKNFKERTGSDHAPGFELHIGHRYFAMTGDVYEGCPEALRVVGVEDVAWLINEVGQRFASTKKPNSTNNETASSNGEWTTNHADNSRSARSMRKLASLYHQGVIDTCEEGKARLLRDDDSGVVDWMLEKGLANGERELRRTWDKIIKTPRDWDRIQRELAEDLEVGDAKPERPAEQAAADWPEPMDIFGALTRAPVLTPDMLPEKIRDFVYDQSELLGCDPGAMAVTALAICSSLISDEITIQPRRFDTTYLESARLWLMLVGQISNKKTPMLKKLTAAIRCKQAEMKQKYDFEKEKYRNALALYEMKRRIWIGRKAEGDDDAIEPGKPEKPRELRLLTTDYTNERLAEILCDNPRGILVLMDEIMLLFGGFDAYKSGRVNRDRPVTLEGYNGGPRDIDRVGSKDDRIHVSNWSFSIVGGIQQSKFDQIGEKLADDGLLQRFLLIPMEPPKIGVDRPPLLTAIEEYNCLIQNLIGFDPHNPKPVVLSEGAHKYREQIDELVSAFESFPGLSEAFQAYAGKFGGTFARLLLTMHVIENCPGWAFNEGLEERERLKVVGEETARRTFDIMTRFLIPHAIRQYERLDTKAKRQDVEDARRFAGYILSHGRTQVTNRVLHDASKDFRDKNRAAKMMAVLTAAAWVSGDEVNPRVHEIYVERAAHERKIRAERKAKLELGRETIRQIYG
jgi:hypothetical protein